MIRTNKLPDAPCLAIREMEDKDVESVTELFAKFMQRYDMVPNFSSEEIKHQLLSGNGTGNVGDGGRGRRKGQVTWCYVVEVRAFRVRF